MVKASPRDIAGYVNKLPSQFRVVLIFGRDEGLAREYAEKIGKQIVEDLSDPFSVARPTMAQVKENPSLLLDEVAAISMMGGRRLIRFEGVGNDAKAAVNLVLESEQGDGLLVITAGDLKPTSALRKAVEASKIGLSIACYEDSAQDVAGLVHEVLVSAGLRANQDAMAYLIDNLGSDRMISRSELQKLILYKGQDKSEVSLEEAEACVGDTAALGLNQIAEAVTAGDLKNLEKYIQRAWIAGESPIAILRVVQSRLGRLHLARGHMDQGMGAGDAVSKLRPPVFFKEKPAFTSQLTRWSLPKLNRALELVMQAELDCKTTGNPAETLCARLLLSLAKAA
ncbi:DNA polymerase III subunit delta [Temperatibacter marinus]|uniref:DNA-directed DNA polymerase n=1 Tax=Temperatibacter marinus TaxID=1456591 RepID=A0AA52HA80_9PROT|nr:DNA polymerase III subunit delta [Temperatibacter marinus]WND03699.1 DNA polymerase III subunit delta [Temperatibacter marinus]